MCATNRLSAAIAAVAAIAPVGRLVQVVMFELESWEAIRPWVAVRTHSAPVSYVMDYHGCSGVVEAEDS